MLKKICIMVAGIMMATTLSVSAERNLYNEMDSVNLTNQTLGDYATSVNVSIEEFRAAYGLPADMPADTNEAIALGHMPIKKYAESLGVAVDEMIEYYKNVCIGTEEITGETLLKDVEKRIKLGAVLSEEIGIEEFKVAYGLPAEVTLDTSYGEIANKVGRVELAMSGLLSYDDGNAILVMLKGKYLDFDVAPAIENNSVLVPMRNIFTALGAEVSWQGDVQTVLAVRGEDTIAMQLGQNYLFKNNERIEIPTASIAKDGRVLVPIRAVAEALDTEVFYNGNTRTVVIH